MTDNPQHPPTLSIEGASLRPLRASDAPAIYAYLSNPAVTELTSYPTMTMAMIESMIERYQHRWATGEWSKWGIALENDQIVGLCGFNEWSKAHRWAEIGFDLAQDQWGHGRMRDAVEAVLQWTFSQDQIDRIHGYVRIDNQRSSRLLERLGFVKEGCLRKFRVCRGIAHDYFIYGLLRSDFQQHRPVKDPVIP